MDKQTEIATLRKRASEMRLLAGAVTPDPAAAMLLQLADELDAEADALEAGGVPKQG